LSEGFYYSKKLIIFPCQMRLRLFIISIIYYLFFTSASAQAQSGYVITGQVEDTMAYSIPLDAVVLLSKQNDTITHSKTDQEGHFFISVNEKGNYLLQIVHPSYHLFSYKISVTDSITHLGLLELASNNKLLDEVVIKNHSPSRIVQDTIEFTADSFRIKQFSNAEELLSKIPGIIFNQNGEITYNGKPISEVSLDGNPFLSFSPEKLLALLRGKDLDKIQLFDLKSQQSRMTGITDNVTSKGLNLNLKKEAKTGYYGKLASGLGQGKDVQWDQSGNINSFSDAKRMLFSIETNNTANSSSIGVGGLPQLSNTPKGALKNLSGGAHYDSRLLKNKKLIFNFDYTFLQSNQDISISSTSTNLIPGNEFTSEAKSSSGNKVLTQNAYITTNYALSATDFISASFNTNISTGSNNMTMSSSSLVVVLRLNFLYNHFNIPILAIRIILRFQVVVEKESRGLINTGI
jgi:hypothetical protein